LISIKKYLEKDSTSPVAAELEPKKLLEVTSESYKSVLRAIGKSALRACPATGRELEKVLAQLEGKLSFDMAPEAVKEVEGQIEEALCKWGALTADHLKAKADEVKEILIMLARTAEAVGNRDQRYSGQFSKLTADLNAIANLDDITQVRSSLVLKTTELKSCMDQMSRDGEQSMAQLRTKVSTYKAKLEEVEQLASKDPLTGLANRRMVEGRMEWNITLDRLHCVVMLDLNLFKSINDKHGHGAGDDLLKKFAQELQRNVRADDMVGRWGGDEFIVVLNRDLDGAKSQVQRIRDWVFGDYTIETGPDKPMLKTTVTASVGLAEWQPGRTMEQVIEAADAAMYREKQLTGGSRP
jgi:diguanylate cyclase (GGDEF)-like protein